MESDGMGCSRSKEDHLLKYLYAYHIILSLVLICHFFTRVHVLCTYMKEDTDMVFRDGEWVERER